MILKSHMKNSKSISHENDLETNEHPSHGHGYLSKQTNKQKPVVNDGVFPVSIHHWQQACLVERILFVVRKHSLRKEIWSEVRPILCLLQTLTVCQWLS